MHTRKWKFDKYDVAQNKHNKKLTASVRARVYDVDTHMFLYLLAVEDGLDWVSAKYFEQLYEEKE
jgi:hypothetical protein